MKEDFIFLVKVCYERDVWVMVDFVVNYMGYLLNFFGNLKCNFNNFVFFNDVKYFYLYYFYIKWLEECKD